MFTAKSFLRGRPGTTFSCCLQLQQHQCFFFATMQTQKIIFIKDDPHLFPLEFPPVVQQVLAGAPGRGVDAGSGSPGGAGRALRRLTDARRHGRSHDARAVSGGGSGGRPRRERGDGRARVRLPPVHLQRLPSSHPVRTGRLVVVC